MTTFTNLVGCALPIQLAPMGGGVATPELAAAVSAAGGLGMISSVGSTSLADQVEAMGRMTDAPYGVGFFGFDLVNRADDLALAATRSRVIDIFWAEPDATTVARLHEYGALVFWQVGSTSEALAAADAGCDAVVVQGVEAGGHVRGTTPLRTLLDEVVPQLDLPVVAAGAITTAARAKAAFDAGASAIRVGTRFLATTESAAHPDYVAALLASGDEDTVLTTAFHAGWEDAPHRVLRSAIRDAAAAAEPVAHAELAGQPFAVERWSAMPPSTSCTGQIEAMAMYAGEGVGDITEILSVDEVIALLLTSPGSKT